MTKWPLVQLRRIAHFAYGDSLADLDRVQGPIPVYGSNGRVGTHDASNTGGPVLVIGRKGSYGKVQYSSQPIFAIDTTFYIDSTQTSADLRWLYYALSSIGLDSLSEDVGVPGLSRDRAYGLRLQFPGQIEQQEIADYLDTETARIDALIEKKRRMVELLKEGEARRTDLLALPLLPSSSRRLPTDIPLENQIPSDWSIAPLGSLLKWVTYGFTNPMPTTDEGPFLLTANDIQDDGISFETARHTSEYAYKSLLTDKCRPKRGDILLTKDGSLGRVALFDGPTSCINQSVALLRPYDTSLQTDLLVELLRISAYREALVFNAGGTTIKHLYVSRIIKQRIGFPPTRLGQTTLLADILKVKTAAQGTVSRLELQIGLLVEHRQALITEAVSGTLEIGGIAA